MQNSKADDLIKDIVKAYGRYGTNIAITDRHILPDRIIFQIKLKGNAREAHLRSHAPDVQQKLKLPLFDIRKHQFTLYIVVTLGELVTSDLVALNHLLLDGSSNSGKSGGLQALITSIAYRRFPSQVNFILLYSA